MSALHFVPGSVFAHQCPMPMDLLRELVDRKLPCWIDDPVAIDKLRLLRAAELVAMIVASTPESATSDGPGSRAHVLAITKKGRLVSAAESLVCLDDLLAEQPSRTHGPVTFARQREPSE